MKNTVKIITVVASIVILASTVPAFAHNNPYTNTFQLVEQMNWRSNVTSFGTVSYMINDSSATYTYISTGNALHEMFQYEPAVTNQVGGNHVYTYNHKTGNYTMHSGIISYTSPYSNQTIYEVWSGYISFSGLPISANNLMATSGQLNQWGFVYNSSGIPSFYPNAQNMGDGYWLVGFSTYTYGSTPPPSNATFWQLAMNPPHLP